MIVSLLGIATTLGSCINPPSKPNDSYYAPVLPRTPLSVAQDNGAIYQAGFEQNLYDDRRASHVGGIIIITLNEKTQVSRKANFDIQKDSKTKMGLTSLFSSGMTTNNPIGDGGFSLGAEYGDSCSTKGDSQAEQNSNLTGSIAVTVAEMLPNGILSVYGEKWMTLNTGSELMRIAGLVCAGDITIDNTVSPARVAGARTTYSDTGVFTGTNQPDWLNRLFLSPL